jgi:hypothetical protein
MVTRDTSRSMAHPHSARYDPDMDRKERDERPVPAALRTQRRGLLVCIVLLGGVGACLLYVGLPALSALVSLALAYFVSGMIQLPSDVRVGQLIDTAVERVCGSRFAEAEQCLGQIPARSLRRAGVARIVHLLRGSVALYSAGDAESAVELASLAISVPVPKVAVNRLVQEAHRAAALALRSMAHASLGHVAEAEADADAAESAPGATPSVLAEASLARCLLLARANDRAARASRPPEGTRARGRGAPGGGVGRSDRRARRGRRASLLRRHHGDAHEVTGASARDFAAGRRVPGPTVRLRSERLAASRPA